MFWDKPTSVAGITASLGRMVADLQVHRDNKMAESETLMQKIADLRIAHLDCLAEADLAKTVGENIGKILQG